ncbi:MAG: hypothetical protein ACPH12_03450 [Flavobacteriaceae bacterium]
MKKLLVLSLLFIVSFNSFSQNRKQLGNKLKSFSAEQIATLQTKKMTLSLDLNLKQQNEIFNVFLEEIKFKKTKRGEINERKNNSKEGLSSEEIFNMMNEKLDHQIALNNKMKTILNKDQFLVWQEIKNKQNKGKRKKTV